MTDTRGVLFVPYQDTLGLLSVADALEVCEDVYRCMPAAAWCCRTRRASSSTSRTASTTTGT